jgi:ABC-type nickel/cobalt efflux system permease component RcnA
VPEGDITMGSLIALGASGGLVPCPAALILLLSCISLGRTTFGMLLLLAFSGGLAIVLMATGLVVLYAKNLLPEKHRHAQSPLMRAMPVVSAAIIVVIGVMMTTVSLGWMPAIRFLGLCLLAAPADRLAPSARGRAVYTRPATGCTH